MGGLVVVMGIAFAVVRSLNGTGAEEKIVGAPVSSNGNIPTATTADRSPAEITDLLMLQEFEESEAPQGMSDPLRKRRKIPKDSTWRRDNTKAIVDVEFVGPHEQESISYYVYPTEADAEAAYGNAEVPYYGQKRAGLFSPADGVTCVSWEYDPPKFQGTGGVTECATRRGTMIIWGSCSIDGDVSNGSREHATRLLDVGVAHLVELALA